MIILFAKHINFLFTHVLGNSNTPERPVNRCGPGINCFLTYGGTDLQNDAVRDEVGYRDAPHLKMNAVDLYTKYTGKDVGQHVEIYGY